MEFSRQEYTGVGCHFLLQGIFLTQGSNPGLGSGFLRRSELDFFFFFFDYAAWGNLSSPSRDQTHVPLHWNHTVVTSGPPGKSLSWIIQIKYHHSARFGEAGEDKTTTEQGGFNQKWEAWMLSRANKQRRSWRGKETSGLRRGAGEEEGTPRWGSWKGMQGMLVGSTPGALRWHQGCRLGPEQSRRLCQDYAAQHLEALPWKRQDLVGRATKAKSTNQVAPCLVLSWKKTLWTGDQLRAFDQVWTQHVDHGEQLQALPSIEKEE